MGRFILGFACCAGITLVSAADESKATNKKAEIVKAMESFAGTWEIVTVNPDGATKEARRLVFNKDGTYAALDKDGKELWAGTFEIDPNQTPKVWDHRSHDARKTGTDVLGIYELDADTLKVACVVGERKGKDWTGKPRPKAIDPKQADVVIHLKRIRTAK